MSVPPSFWSVGVVSLALTRVPESNIVLATVSSQVQSFLSTLCEISGDTSEESKTDGASLVVGETIYKPVCWSNSEGPHSCDSNCSNKKGDDQVTFLGSSGDESTRSEGFVVSISVNWVALLVKDVLESLSVGGVSRLELLEDLSWGKEVLVWFELGFTWLFEVPGHSFLLEHVTLDLSEVGISAGLDEGDVVQRESLTVDVSDDGDNGGHDTDGCDEVSSTWHFVLFVTCLV